MFLRSDGTAVACGNNRDGQCDIPALEEGVTYTQVATGGYHTVLLRSDGTAVGIGRNCSKESEIPVLKPGVTYKEIWASVCLTGLICSDGRAVILGMDEEPIFCDAGKPFLSFRGPPEVVVQLSFDGTTALCRSLAGEPKSWVVPDRSSNVKLCVENEFAPSGLRIGVVLPDGRLVPPDCTWQSLSVARRRVG